MFCNTVVEALSAGKGCSFSPGRRNFPRPTILPLHLYKRCQPHRLPPQGCIQCDRSYSSFHHGQYKLNSSDHTSCRSFLHIQMAGPCSNQCYYSLTHISTPPSNNLQYTVYRNLAVVLHKLYKTRDTAHIPCSGNQSKFQFHSLRRTLLPATSNLTCILYSGGMHYISCSLHYIFCTHCHLCLGRSGLSSLEYRNLSLHSSGSHFCRKCTGHCGSLCMTHRWTSIFYSVSSHHQRILLDIEERKFWCYF